MFFCKSDEASCIALRGLLDKYERASGQTINCQKSSIMFGAKTPASRRQRVKHLLQIGNEGGTGKYLGLSENFGRRKRDIFSSIVDQIRQKSQSWSAHFLSQAGKQVMLQSVLTAMPSHAMSCFKIPLSLCKRIQSIFTRFWWDSKPDVRKISWVAWEKLTQAKKDGGLGFRDVEAFNDAMLAKLSWRIFKNPNALVAKVLLGKYCYNLSFLECTASEGASHGWKGVLVGRDVLKRGLGWVVGTGEDIQIWSEPWISLDEPSRPMGPPPELSRDLRVSTLIDAQTRQWDWSQVRRIVPQAEPFIRLLPLSSTVRRDTLVWLYSKTGRYTVKTKYHLIRNHCNASNIGTFNWCKNVWRLNTAPKIKNFLWKALNNALPVGTSLQARGMAGNLLCKRCQQVEDVDHVLLLCPFAQAVWDRAPIQMAAFPQLPSVMQLLEHARGGKALPPTGSSSAHLYAWICWNIWIARNKLVFENTSCSDMDVISLSVINATAWQSAQECRPVRTNSPNEDAHVSPHLSQLPSSFLHCFVDAAWNSSTRNCGLGFNFRDHTDHLFYQSSLSRRFVCSALMAEAFAIMEALKEASNRGIQELQILSDSQVLIGLLNKKEEHIALSNVLLDVHALASAFISVVFTFVARQLNSVADSLAKQALSELETLLSIS